LIFSRSDIFKRAWSSTVLSDLKAPTYREDNRS
jgi:hypothetical protein